MKPLRQKKILVVDDEVELCQLLSDELEFAGAEVLQAHSGNAAFDLIKNSSVDAVVSDIKMQDGDGFELLKKLKSMPGKAPMVLLITGHSSYTAEEAFHAGAEALFSKPCDLDRIVQRLESLFQPLPPGTRQERYVVTDPYSVDLKIPDFDPAKSVRLFNIGKGGMFLSLKATKMPEPNQPIKFSLLFKHPTKKSKLLEGEGICRWTRTETTEFGPKGVGIEFTALQAPSSKFLQEILESLSSRDFVQG